MFSALADLNVIHMYELFRSYVPNNKEWKLLTILFSIHKHGTYKKKIYSFLQSLRRSSFVSRSLVWRLKKNRWKLFSAGVLSHSMFHLNNWCPKNLTALSVKQLYTLRILTSIHTLCVDNWPVEHDDVSENIHLTT